MTNQKDVLEDQEFYEVMQAYRWAGKPVGYADYIEAGVAFETVKKWLRAKFRAPVEPTCSDPGWEMRGGKMVCKGCGREAGDVFAESPSEGPLRRGIGRGYYWLSMESCDSLIAAAELHGVSVVELGVRTKDGFSCVTGVPVKDLKDAVK